MSGRYTFVMVILLPVICFGFLGSEPAIGYKVEQGALSYSVPVNNKYSSEKERIYSIVQNQARYLTTTVKSWRDDSTMKLLTESKSGEHHIRPNACTIAGFAFLYCFGDYDSKAVGCTREQLLNSYIIPMMRYLVRTHKTGDLVTDDKHPWGHAWQSAHWTYALGKGAWWVWDELPGELRIGVREVVGNEADRIVKSKPPHQLNHDSKSEENAWNSQVLSVAIVLMPEDERREVWERKLQYWILSSYLRSADETSDEIVDGKKLSEQFNGANIFDDYTLENHGFIHPDYMTAWVLSTHLALDYMMTERAAPQACFHNIAEIYENLKWFSLPDGGFVYPNGQDWGLFRNADWSSGHALAAVFFKDAEALTMLHQGLVCTEKMQARNPAGNVYSKEEYFFASTQHDLLYWLSISWLTLNFAQEEVKPARLSQLGTKHLESGKIILNRNKKAVHSVAWGKRIMIQCMPDALDRIVSPHERNGIGFVKLKGDKWSLKPALESVKLLREEKSFSVELVVIHGGKVRADITVQSSVDGTMSYKETLTAIKDITTVDVNTCFWGVLNNPMWVYENGKRMIAIGEKVYEVKAQSGQSLAGEARRVVVDGRLEFVSQKQMLVSYESSVRSERARVTDHLSLNRIKGIKDWKAGETISENNFTIRVSRCGFAGAALSVALFLKPDGWVTVRQGLFRPKVIMKNRNVHPRGYLAVPPGRGRRKCIYYQEFRFGGCCRNPMWPHGAEFGGGG